jgi:hypothetical protein
MTVKIESTAGTYFESSAFIAAATPLIGFERQSSFIFSVVDCTFQGFETGIYAEPDSSDCFVCHSAFDTCATCIRILPYPVMIASPAILARELQQVTNCVFDSVSAPAIEYE